MAALDTDFANHLLSQMDTHPLLAHSSLEEQARATASFLASITPKTAVSFWIFNVESNALSCLLGLNDEQKSFATGFKITSESAGHILSTLMAGKLVQETQLETSNTLGKMVNDYFVPQGSFSALMLPIRHQDQLMGALLWESHDKDRTEWKMEQLVLALGQVCALKGAYFSFTSSRTTPATTNLAELQKQLDSRTEQLDNVLAELRATQAHLLETEKLVALGNLVAGVAHEVNTPIGVSITAVSHMSTTLQQFKNAYQEQRMKRKDLDSFLDTCHETMEILDNNLARAAEMVKNFKIVAVNQANDVLEDIMLKQLMESLIKSLKHETKKKKVNIELKGPAETSLKSYSGSLYQIFTNLILNSVFHGFDTMEAGKCKIIIEFESNDQNIIINYSDNGVGLSEEARDHILEPFFTTKRKSGGSGLGMYIVNNLIVSKLHGQFSLVNSAKGFACRFTLPKKL
jgi:two-component system NtrC family sensor kinase